MSAEVDNRPIIWEIRPFAAGSHNLADFVSLRQEFPAFISGYKHSIAILDSELATSQGRNNHQIKLVSCYLYLLYLLHTPCWSWNSFYKSGCVSWFAALPEDEKLASCSGTSLVALFANWGFPGLLVHPFLLAWMQNKAISRFSNTACQLVAGSEQHSPHYQQFLSLCYCAKFEKIS